MSATLTQQFEGFEAVWTSKVRVKARVELIQLKNDPPNPSPFSVHLVFVQFFFSLLADKSTDVLRSEGFWVVSCKDLPTVKCRPCS